MPMQLFAPQEIFYMQNGWIKLHRQLLKWEWYDDINTKVLFLHLLLTVNFENKKWRGQTIKQGERITSLKKLANETKLSVKQIRVSLKKLEKTGEVARKGTNKYTHIILINWREYQKFDDKRASKRTNEGQSKGNQRATTKEGKEIQEGKEKRGTPSQLAKEFFEQPERHQEIITYLVSKGLSESQATNEIKKFILYWTEPNKTGTKQRWQMQRTFEVKRRLLTWIQNIRPTGREKETKGIKL